MRYVLDFGSANLGGGAVFGIYKDADTLDNMFLVPTIVEIGSGLYYFEEPWASTTVTSIVYRVTLNGVELSDVIRSDTLTPGALTAGAAAGINPWLWTAGQIINMAAVEVGLAETADPYASTDPAMVQLRTLLKSAGMEITQTRDWQVLVRECTLTGDGSTTAFALPEDFLRMKDRSGWNRSDGEPLALLSPRQWQAMKAWSAASAVEVFYRVQQGRVVFYQAPALGADLRFEYVSRYWVAAGASADAYFPSTSAHVVVLEPLMVTRLLKAKFLQAKNLDSQGAFAEYQQALEDAINQEPHRVLSLEGPTEGMRFLDEFNLPDTGYAQ